MKRLAAGFALSLTIFWVAGCASSPLKRIDDLQSELPPELQSQFKVQDASEGSAGPAQPAASASAGSATVASGSDGANAQAKPKKNPKEKSKSGSAKTGSPATHASAGAAVSAAAKATVFPNRRPVRDPIWVGEKQVYEVTYFGMAAGDFTLEVKPHKIVQGRKAYHAVGTAKSSSVFSVFYKLDDMIETFIDFEGIFSHRFHLVLDETKQTRDSLELNDSVKGRSFYWSRWNKKDEGPSEVKEYFDMKPFSQDSLSALYYLRTVPLPPGAVVTFPVISEGKSWEGVATVVRRETLTTPMGKLPTVMLKIDSKFQGVLKKSGDSYIWLIDDDRRQLALMEAKVKIGTVVATLKKQEPGTPPAN